MTSIKMDDLIKKTTINRLVPSLDEYKGYTLGCNFNKMNEIDNFNVRDTDVWVCSYPKSGTTWTQEMVWLLMNNLDYEGAKRPINVRFPCIEMEIMFNCNEIEEGFGYNEETYSFAHSIEYTRNITVNPRCVKTHLPWDLLPKAIRSKEKSPKIICVVRNPKDTCVSYYHHSVLLHEFDGTFEEFATLFLNDKVLWSPYWDSVESYWKERDESNVLIIKFEDMKKDLKSIVLKVAKFLNKDIKDDDIEKLLYHLSFKSMKDNPYTTYDHLPEHNSNGKFMRKGIVGDYKNEMKPELIEKFDKWIEENNKFGIKFNLF